MTASPTATVVVPTYERASFLGDTIDSLRAQASRGAFEIVVVDNAPGERLQQYVVSLGRTSGPPVRYVSEPRAGLHYARHAGARVARGDILFYVDDDVIPEDGWLEALVNAFSERAIVCAGGRVLPCWEETPPDWVTSVPKGFFSLLDYGDEPRLLAQMEYINGCNLAIRREVLWEVGGFNPDGFGDRRQILFRGDGEYGLLRKVRSSGYQVAYVPKAVVRHRIPSRRLSLSSIRRRAFDAGIESSYCYYRYRRPTSRQLVARVARHAARVTYHSSYRVRAEVLGRPHQVIAESIATQFSLGQLRHAVRLLTDHELRLHCLRESYVE